MSDVTVQNEPEKKGEVSGSGDPPVPVSPQESGKPSLSGDAVFNENITIYTGNRLSQYDKGPVKAYAARGTDRAPANLVAFVCEDNLTPRILKTPNYASIINPSLVPLVASGPMYWAPSGKEKYCLIYENKLGNPIMREDLRGGLGLKPDLVLHGVIRPLINVLADMRDKDIVHGNIRGANLFDGGNRNLERTILGECLSLPPGYHQPVLYEPIDRALVSPLGRGVGTHADDMYALGVLLAVMMRHFDPLEGLSDEEIVERKIEEGSYVALLSRDRFSGSILELLRGLLQDEESQRWTIDEALQWLDGRRLSPKQPVRRSKASRPLLFNNEKYIRPELLSRDLNKNISEARQLIDNGEIEQWLSRALDNKMAVARYESALEQAEEGGKGTGYTERLVTRVAIALHPEGPMRFKNINVLPDGVGASLYESFIMKRDLQTYIDFFMNYFITQWIDAQPNGVPDVSTIISKFDGARAFLRAKGLGNGLERCIYSLNSEAPCLSEKLHKYYVRTPEDMLRAFEKMASLPDRPAMFFDRHSVSFLLVKDRKNIDPFIHDLNAPETYRRILAECKILATIQKRSTMERLPGVAKWMVENLEPVYERFHDRELRVELKKKAERLQDSGELAKIIALFDDPVVYQEDNTAFRKAMRKHHELEAESSETEADLADEDNFGRDTGRQAAAVLACVLAAIIILITGFMSFGGSGKTF